MPAYPRSQVSEEELERRFVAGGGRPLADILAEAKARGFVD